MSNTKPYDPNDNVVPDLHLTKPFPEAVIDQAVWDIWQFVRENAHSLNSGHCTAMIREMVDQAMADIRVELEFSKGCQRRANKANKALREKHGLAAK
jgi:hypothetical protein